MAPILYTPLLLTWRKQNRQLLAPVYYRQVFSSIAPSSMVSSRNHEAETPPNESTYSTSNNKIISISEYFMPLTNTGISLAFRIRLKVEKVEAVVIATAVLDNTAKLLNEVDPPINEEDEAAITLVANINEHPDMNIYNMHGIHQIKYKMQSQMCFIKVI
nr:unnamed protein product [Callosobruchus analis]